jgi:hypothetical protein
MMSFLQLAAEKKDVILAKMMSFLQLAAEKNTSFWRAWQSNIQPFLFC